MTKIVCLSLAILLWMALASEDIPCIHNITAANFDSKIMSEHKGILRGLISNRRLDT